MLPRHRKEVIEVLQETRKFLLRSDNFLYSPWDDADQAVKELDRLIRRVSIGRLPSRLEWLYMPIGPLQEVSASCGWADEYVSLAKRFDHAIARARRIETRWAFVLWLVVIIGLFAIQWLMSYLPYRIDLSVK